MYGLRHVCIYVCVYVCMHVCTSLMAQIVKNLSVVLQTRVRSLSQEDTLEKGMATHCNILAWRVPWTEEPDRLRPWDHKELETTEQLTLSER